MTTSVGVGRFTYRVDEGWEQLPPGWDHLDVAGVAVDSQDQVYVFNRGAHPVIVYDRAGNFLRAWGEGVIASAHGITIGPDDAVYCVDVAGHSVRKFTTRGELELTIGTPGVPSETGATTDYRTITHGGAPFHRPTNLAISRGGNLYVSDGYLNARVHCFDPNGVLLFSWGEPGNGPGQFNLPHALAIGDDDRVFVADRENSRLQIFDLEGHYLTEWVGINRPDDLAIDREGNVFVLELGQRAGLFPFMPPSTPQVAHARLSVFDRLGNPLARWGSADPCSPGSFVAPHGICIDSHGDLDVGEVNWAGGGNRGDVPSDCHTLQKFVRISGA